MDSNEGVRINKYLSEAGFCSRRKADKLVGEGKVYIDGELALVGSKVYKGQSVVCDGVELKKQDEFVLIAFNKPRGVVCTASKKDKDNIVDFIGYDKRIYPIGRLDKQSEGLILLTNNGDIVNGILKARNYHEKEYIVTVNKKISDEFLKGMSKGVVLEELNTVTRPCKVKKVNDNTFKIILTQGLNRQIRRMCEKFDLRVVKLKRVRIMNIRLGNLGLGAYRKLNKNELDELFSLIEYKN